MAWRDLFSQRTGGLDRIHQRLRDMLDINRQTLGLGVSGLLGTTDLAAVHERARRSDARVDDLARQVRRELVVHAAVRGAQTDLPAMLAAMSIVNDIQRIGDHATGLARLARIHGHFTPRQPDHMQLATCRTRLDAHVAAARDLLRTHDPTVAAEQITSTVALTDEIDLAIDLLLVTDATEGTTTALAYQHLSRIAVHVTNIVTSVALPLDQLDHHDVRDRHGTPQVNVAT